jgi:hypothetical protein
VVDLSALIRRESGLDDPLLLRVLRLLLSFAKALSDSLRSILDARVLKQKVLTIAAHLLEAPRDDLELAEGRIRVRGAPTSGVTLAQIAQKAYLAPTELPPGMEPGLEATHAFDPPALTSRAARTSARSRSTPRPAT